MFAVLYLMFGVPAFLLTYAVLYRVVTRNGNSGAWTLLPLAPVALLVGRAVAFGQSAGVGAASPDTLSAVTVGLWLACFTGWLALLIIAGIRWSEVRELRRHSRGG
jgi:hypothetical protein